MTATRTEVIEFLRRRTALIVHFASVPTLSGTGLRYPDSLLRVIGDRTLELSCSVVQPGDGFGIGALPKNATGMIGLILSPNSDSSVMAVDAFDAGSIVQPGGRRHFSPQPIDVGAMDGSIAARGQVAGPQAAYNEWGMCDYEILGLFVANTLENEVMYGGATAHDYEPVVTTMARFNQPVLRAITFDAGGLGEIIEGGVRPVQHTALYI